MNPTARNWIAGCSIGCLGLLVLGALVGFGLFRYGKDLVGQFEEGSDLRAEVIERYGRIRDFIPEPTGRIEPGRVERFLQVRQQVEPVRSGLERSLAVLSGQDSGSGGESGSLLLKIQKGATLLPDIARFYRARSTALLNSEMGLGEYIYLYTVVYYCWLQKSPGDGQSFQIVGDSGARGEPWDEFEVREERSRRIMTRLNRQMLPVLRNQITKLDETGGDSQWREALRSEIEAMETDSYRLPWSDGLPDPLRVSLEPYRQELESSYSALCNDIEMALEGN